VKDLGSSDIYPQSLQHSPNGRFVTVCGDGEYVIYTALAWRNSEYPFYRCLSLGVDLQCVVTGWRPC
jgi:hypothetical protein